MSSYMPTERARKKEIAKTAKTPTVPSGAKRFYFSIIGEPHHDYLILDNGRYYKLTVPIDEMLQRIKEDDSEKEAERIKDILEKANIVGLAMQMVDSKVGILEEGGVYIDPLQYVTFNLSKEKDQRLFNARYALLSLLSDEERLEVMNNFCQHCGKGLEDGKKCYCSPGFDK